MKKLLCLAMAILMLLMPFSGCTKETSDDKMLSRISSKLSVNITEGQLTFTYDSHGGFHGDGTSFYSIKLDRSLNEELAASGKWHPLPMPESIAEICYGSETEDTATMPLITKSNDWGNPLMPEVTNGYYFFVDRHPDATDSSDPHEVWERYSFNFTLALYDSDTNTLYYAEVDT